MTPARPRPRSDKHSQALDQSALPADRSDLHGDLALDGRTRTQQVCTRLRTCLAAGQLVDDAGRLPSEGKLSATFNVSRTVIREALKWLQGEGLIRLAQGRRAELLRTSPPALGERLAGLLTNRSSDIRDVLDLRRALEVEICGLAADHASAEQVRAIAEHARRLDFSEHLDVQVDADWDFHRDIAAAAGNPLLQSLLEAMEHIIRDTLNHTLSHAVGRVTKADHQCIVNAIAAGDADAARQAMRDHMAHACADALDEPYPPHLDPDQESQA